MKAVFFEKPGGLDVLTYGDLPTPQPKKGEALIHVRACGLNHLDLWLREDRDNSRNIPLPHISGSDVSGIIDEINGKSSFNVGDAVVVNPAIPCGTCSRCTTGNPCELVNIFGVKNQGGYAEYATVPLGQIYLKPTALSFVEAAAFPLTFLTAWHMLVGRAHLQKGEIVFIWGASGGLGSSAIQIANYLGANIFAAAKSRNDAQHMKIMGAHEVIIYPEENVVEVVKARTRGVGVDVVFESVGEKTWTTTLALLRPFGRVVIAGTTSGNIGTQDLSDLYVRQLTILGARMGTQNEFEKVLALVATGALKPVIDTVFPLNEARAAQQRMEERKHLGKIVLEV